MQLKWVIVFTYFYAREKIHLDLHAILNIRLLPLFNTFSSNLNFLTANLNLNNTIISVEFICTVLLYDQKKKKKKGIGI